MTEQGGGATANGATANGATADPLAARPLRPERRTLPRVARITARHVDVAVGRRGRRRPLEVDCNGNVTVM